MFPSFLLKKTHTQEHPDRGGDAEKFKLIAKAYETLSNPEQRAIYDVHGEEAVKNSGQGQGQGHEASNASDIFSKIFGMAGSGGGGSGSSSGSGRRKGNDTLHNINVPLEELYKGKVLYSF